MRRRDFLRLIATGVVGSQVDVDRLLWEPNKKTIFIPSDSQVAFFNNLNKYPALWGVPYHQSNASSGAWLGIPRLEAYEELGKLVRLIEEAKKRDL